MYILINALGITDSGGITILKKCLKELMHGPHTVIVGHHQNKWIEQLAKQYSGPNEKIRFIAFQKKGVMHRLYIENWYFRKVIHTYKIQLIYNFSGSAQFFFPIPQIIKLQNLMFYSNKLDTTYWKQKKFWLWIKQIFLKRILFLAMYHNQKYFEIQSFHVQECFSNYCRKAEKIFYIKSDIDVNDKDFLSPKQYDFSQKISFLYIIGPHFNVVHKNFKDFVEAMSALKKLGYNFTIHITLSKEQLQNSDLWDSTLNDRTHFLGYSSQEVIEKQFLNNTILISTSIIETLGLHVIEAIKNGVLSIVPNEPYSLNVYGNNIFQYEISNIQSLVNTFLDIIALTNSQCQSSIVAAQQELKIKEKRKIQSISELFNTVLKDIRVY